MPLNQLYHLRDILKLRSDQNQVPVPAAVTAADVSDRQDVVPAEKGAHDVQGRSEANGDKTAPEGVDEESRQESSADVAEARSSPKANALETGRKTTDPVDGTPLSWEERSEVGEDVGDEDDYGDDGDVVDSRDMYHDDPFFGGTWPGVLPKVGLRAVRILCVFLRRDFLSTCTKRRVVFGVVFPEALTRGGGGNRTTRGRIGRRSRNLW